MDGFRVEIMQVPIDGATAVVSSTESPTTGKLYFGLTSRGNMLAEYDPETNAWRDLGFQFETKADFEGSEEQRSGKIHNSLCADNEGLLYIGQGTGIDYHGAPAAFDLKKYGGACIYRIDPEKNEIKNLGQATRVSSIHAMALDPVHKQAFGYSQPDNHFFRFDCNTGEAFDYGQISPEHASHDVVATPEGDAYIAHGVYKRGQYHKHIYLCKYDHKTDTFTRWTDFEHMVCYAMAARIGGNAGVDVFARTKSGLIYGGTTFESKIFSIDPRTDKVEFHGAPPVMSPGIRCLREGEDGILYGSAGYPKAQIFSFNPKTRVFNLHGTPDPERESGYFYFHCLSIDRQNCMYIGETDAQKCIVYKLIPN